MENSSTALIENAELKREAEDTVAVNNSNSFEVPRQLVADYSSGSEDESSEDSDSDSTEKSESLKELKLDSSSESDIDELLQPVEELKISVLKEQAKAIGTVKHIVECQVVVEPITGAPILDLGTVLFLDEGQRALGRVDDVFGPVTEPLYIVLFNSNSEIKTKSISPGLKVYYAPQTDHTSYAPVADLMRLKGSDASWKHNQEAPLEYQDFSDDEAEAMARGEIQPNRGTCRPPKRSWQQRRGNHSQSPHAACAPNIANSGTSPRQLRMPTYPQMRWGRPQYSAPSRSTSFNYSQNRQPDTQCLRPPMIPHFNPIVPPPSAIYSPGPPMMPMLRAPPMYNVASTPMLSPHGIPPSPMSNMQSPPLFNTCPPPPPPSPYSY